MIVFRQHDVKPTYEERIHMLRVLHEVAFKHFRSPDYYIDEQQRSLPDHYHAHARRKGEE